MTEFLFQIFLLSLYGTPYKWGGSNPMSGFDCSGFVRESMASVGIRCNGSSNDLYQYFLVNGLRDVRATGSLVFYGDATAVTHVAVMLDKDHIIEAASGDHTTTDLQTAISQNAFVKVRPYLYRKDFVAIIQPRGLPFSPQL